MYFIGRLGSFRAELFADAGAERCRRNRIHRAHLPPPEPSESVVPGAGEHGQPAPAFEQRQVDGVVDALRSLSCGRWRGPAPERATQEREGSPEPTRTVLTLRFADVIEARQFAATFDPACAEGWRITSAQRGRSVVLEALRQ